MTEIDFKPKTRLLQWNEEDIAKILKQYDRKPDDLKADVSVIREWLKTQPHLPLQPSDRQIVYFLLLNKFSFEKTKTKLEMNYTIKSLVPEFFSIPPKDPRIEESMNSLYLFPLPQLTKNSNRIIIKKCQNPDTFNFCDTINYAALVMELRTIYDISNSEDYIVDLQNVNLTFVSKMNIIEIKKCISIWESVYSSRISALHILNLPKFAESLASVIISLLKEKIQLRVHYHKSVEDLWEFYPREVLPKEFGGTKPLEEYCKEWLELVRENSDYLEKVQKARIVENLRPEKMENDEILGYHGNFRKLQID